MKEVDAFHERRMAHARDVLCRTHIPDAPANDLPHEFPTYLTFDGEALGHRIKALRVARQLTLQQVADAASLTKSHVWELERGSSRNPTVNAVWGLARALVVSPATLLGLNDQLPPLHPTALRIAGIVDAELRIARTSTPLPDTAPLTGEGG